MRGINSSFWGSCFEKFCSRSKKHLKLVFRQINGGVSSSQPSNLNLQRSHICGLCIHLRRVLEVNGCCSPNGSFCGCRLYCSPEIIMHFQCLWWPLWPWSTHWSTCSQWSLCFPPAWPLQNRCIFFLYWSFTKDMSVMSKAHIIVLLFSFTVFSEIVSSEKLCLFCTS